MEPSVTRSRPEPGCRRRRRCRRCGWYPTRSAHRDCVVLDTESTTWSPGGRPGTEGGAALLAAVRWIRGATTTRDVCAVQVWVSHRSRRSAPCCRYLVRSWARMRRHFTIGIGPSSSACRRGFGEDDAPAGARGRRRVTPSIGQVHPSLKSGKPWLPAAFGCALCTAGHGISANFLTILSTRLRGPMTLDAQSPRSGEAIRAQLRASRTVPRPLCHKPIPNCDSNARCMRLVSGPLYWLARPHSFIIAFYSTASDSPNFAWSMPQTRSKLFSAGFQQYFRPVGWSLVTIVNEWPCHRFLKTRPAISSTGMK